MADPKLLLPLFLPLMSISYWDKFPDVVIVKPLLSWDVSANSILSNALANWSPALLIYDVALLIVSVSTNGAEDKPSGSVLELSPNWLSFSLYQRFVRLKPPENAFLRFFNFLPLGTPLGKMSFNFRAFLLRLRLVIAGFAFENEWKLRLELEPCAHIGHDRGIYHPHCRRFSGGDFALAG